MKSAHIGSFNLRRRRIRGIHLNPYHHEPNASPQARRHSREGGNPAAYSTALDPAFAGVTNDRPAWFMSAPDGSSYAQTLCRPHSRAFSVWAQATRSRRSGLLNAAPTGPRHSPSSGISTPCTITLVTITRNVNHARCPSRGTAAFNRREHQPAERVTRSHKSHEQGITRFRGGRPAPRHRRKASSLSR